MDNSRGTGRTKRQIENAPHGALFVWVNERTHYPRALARAVNRDDLVIVGPSALNADAERLRGTRYPAIIVDHAAFAFFTEEQFDGLDYAMASAGEPTP